MSRFASLVARARPSQLGPWTAIRPDAEPDCGDCVRRRPYARPRFSGVELCNEVGTQLVLSKDAKKKTYTYLYTGKATGMTLLDVSAKRARQGVRALMGPSEGKSCYAEGTSV